MMPFSSDGLVERSPLLSCYDSFKTWSVRTRATAEGELEPLPRAVLARLGDKLSCISNGEVETSLESAQLFMFFAMEEKLELCYFLLDVFATP